jgi:cellulose synthase/poly-beta-1,6-N-acetylglucosamine synthase-like glycosyltransferase
MDRVYSGILRWFHPDLWQLEKDYSYQPTVSVIIPCFNEGRVVYDTIESVVHSDYPAEKLEVIAVDDCSRDDSYVWIKKAAADFPNVFAHQTPVNSGGKDGATMYGFRRSVGDVILLTDSDTLFDADTVKELVVCLSDPTIGAAAGSVRVRNQNQSLIAAFQAYTYFIVFELTKTAQSFMRTVACCSGAMLTIRRHLLVEIQKELEERHWFGIPVHDGEDRFITHRVILKGWGTYTNPAAKCWTAAPATFTEYFKQQLRWRRTGLRDFFFTVRTLHRHLDLHPGAIYGYLIQPLATFIPLIAGFYAAMSGELLEVSIVGLVSFFLSAVIAAFFLNKYDPEHAIKTPIKLALCATLWALNTVFLTILAMFTLDQAGWVTRDQKPKEEKAVV